MITTTDDVILLVAQFYRIHSKALVSQSRTRRVSFARHVAMYLSRKLPGYTNAEIGQDFGGRDHTSVIGAAKKIEKLISSNERVRREVEHLEVELNLSEGPRRPEAPDMAVWHDGDEAAA